MAAGRPPCSFSNRLPRLRPGGPCRFARPSYDGDRGVGAAKVCPCGADHGYPSDLAKEIAMLDFTSDFAGDDLSTAKTSEASPINDQALLDAYSNAVIAVTERGGPAVGRVETGPKAGQMPGNRGERGGLGSGIVFSSVGLVLSFCFVVGSSLVFW